MILLNFAPGSGGFFLLKAAQAHWPETFRYEEARRTFLPGHTPLDDNDAATMIDLSAQPSLVLCNNKDIIPNAMLISIRHNGRIFCVTCNDPEDKIRSNFLYWCQAPDRAFDYVNSYNADLGVYQAMYQQMLIHVNAPETTPEGTTIDFGDFADYSSIQSWLTAVKLEYNLGDMDAGGETTYQSELSQMLAPLSQHADLYNDFRAAWIEMSEHSFKGQYNYPDYTTVFSSDTVVKFRRVVDFLQSLYDNYAPLRGG